jgi:methylenetetrahydrofolate dehydrogenase (NADP+)/methenyltetrahydrofolate cyclohydrolase
MTAQIIDGKIAAEAVFASLKTRVDKLKRSGLTPGLATVLIGDDPASHVYVGHKVKACGKVGMVSIHKPLPKKTSEAEALRVIDELNRDPKVHGIIVQLPLPSQLEPQKLVQRLDPAKDADGLHPINQGKLVRARSWKEIETGEFSIPCTPLGVIDLLRRCPIQISGKHAVVVGRSSLVGKPVAQLLLALDATVTMCHSKSADLPSLARQGDILVAAIGKANFIQASMIKPGAVVIDVGISRTEAGLKGDVDFPAAKEVASWITPVPGGVGPMTVAMLLSNTVRTAERSM